MQIVDRKKEILVTAGGKNVPPANVERELTGQPAIANAVVYGDGKKYLVAGLWLDDDALIAELGHAPTLAEREAAAASAVERANGALARCQQVKKFALMRQPLTVEDGLLTATLKLKRKRIYARYAKCSRRCTDDRSPREQVAAASVRRPRGRYARGHGPVADQPALHPRPAAATQLCPGVAASGRDVYLIDWGTPGDEDRDVSFDHVCDRYIGRALRVATRTSDTRQAHLLGYCMGGTLAAIHAALRPERVASLCAIAAPVAFAEAGIMAQWVRTGSFDVGALVDASGLVPWPLLQAAFHLIHPTSAVSKAVRFVDRWRHEGFAETFFAVERWGADNVSLPGAFFATYIDALYRNDALIAGELTVAGRRVALDAITCPVGVVSFERDPIVPAASATPLLDAVGTGRTTHLPAGGGHVSGMVSRGGAKNLWPAVISWFT